MAVREMVVQRFSTVSHKSFREVEEAVERELGHPDIATFTGKIAAASDSIALETIVQEAVGPSGFLQFARFDVGAVLAKGCGLQGSRIVRLILGNPLIMRQMARYVPDAASYAPVTVLLDERPDGVHLSYDRMATYLSPYGNLEALRAARELDGKVEALLMSAAADQPLVKTARD